MVFQQIARSVILVVLLVSTNSYAVAGGATPTWQEAPPDLVGGTVAATVVEGKVYVVAGTGASYGNAMEAYDVRQQMWSLLPSKPCYCWESAGIAAAGGKIYAIGGVGCVSNDDSCERIMDIYTMRTRTWTTPPPPSILASGGAVTAGHDGRIYVAGGGSVNPGVGSVVSNQWVAYDPHTGRWRQLKALPISLYRPAITVGLDGRIYVVGGVTSLDLLVGGAKILDLGVNCAIDLQTTCATKAVEVYDPKTNRWTSLAPLLTARASPAAVTGSDGRIYAIGGTSQSMGIVGVEGVTPRPLASVEAYDPRTNRWTAVASLHTPRYWLTAAIVGSTIYAIGGVSPHEGGKSNIQSMETYTIPSHDGS